MTMIGDALESLADVFDDNESVEMTYRRGETVETILMTPGRVNTEAEVREIVGINTRNQQFVVRRSNIPESIGIPQVNDEIDYLDETWVLSPYEGEFCYRAADSHKIRLRLFTTLKPSE